MSSAFIVAKMTMESGKNTVKTLSFVHLFCGASPRLAAQSTQP
jgi:hypothetical protein